MAVLKLYPLDLDARQQCGGATYVRTGSQAESPFRSAGTLERVRADTVDPVVGRMMVGQRANRLGDIQTH